MTAHTDVQAAPPLQDLVAHTARATGYLPADFEVVRERNIHSAMDTDGTFLRVLDLRGPEGVMYRARAAHEDDTTEETPVLLDVVVGDGHLEDERPVYGPMSHQGARTAALNYTRYMAALSH